MKKASVNSLQIASITLSPLAGRSSASDVSLRTLALLFVWCLLLGPSSALAQNVQYTNNLRDKTKRSSFRVDPSTLALNIEIPIEEYPGRAGTGLPITLNYSSKLWRMKFVQAGDSQGGNTYGTWVAPTWGEHTASGWTSTLGVPTLIDDPQELYDSSGVPTSDCSNGCWVVRKVQVQMPDGSSHVLRHTSPIAQLTASFSGTYYAIDGSGLRYEYDSRTLYLPDGSYYVLGSLNAPSTATTLTDRNGNRLIYNPSANLWTDTLGRTLTPPPIPRTPGDYQYSIPGVGTTSMVYTFKWRALANALTVPSQQLAYPGDCSGILLTNPPSGTTLFQSIGPDAVCEEAPSSPFNPSVLAEIVLPNNTSYKFTYNLYGEIDKVIYPTGGYERFVYDTVTPTDWVFGVYEKANRGVVDHYISASGSGTNEVHWHYSANYLNGNKNQPYKVTITAPDNTYTERYLYAVGQASVYWGFNDVRVGRAYDERSFSSTGQMLRRTLTEWTASPEGSYANKRDARVTKQVQLLLDTGGDALSKTTTYQYDADLNVISTGEWDFVLVSQSTGQTGAISLISAGTVLRTSEATYLVNDTSIASSTRAAYRARNLLRLPTSTRMKNGDGNGSIVAQAEVRYDEATYTPLTCGATVSWSDPGVAERGSATTARHWLDTTNTWIETHAQFDSCGSPRKSWDAPGNVSEIKYDDSFTEQIGVSTYAYPTHTISAVPDPTTNHGTNMPLETFTTYDYSTGLVRSTTDANNKTTGYQYNDALDRLTQVDRPDGGRTTYNYVDAHQCGPYIESRTLLDVIGQVTRETDDYVFFDGLGRSVRTFKYDGQPSTPYLTTDIQYDALGRVYEVSNPYRSSGCGTTVNPTGLWTTTAYDALGRATSVTTPDRAQVSTSYSGNTVTVTDQAGKKRKSVTDALGRLTQVIEDPIQGGYNYQTIYTYDALNNLRLVTQGSQLDAQHRYFMYDSLSRLIRSKNPEQDAYSGISNLTDSVSGNNQWSMSYSYDDNGNLAQKIDARGRHVNYTYDNLNRNITTLYRLADNTVDPDTPDVEHLYDGAINGRGRPWISWTWSSSARSEAIVGGYDAVGRVATLYRRFYGSGGATHDYEVNCQYDLAGNVTSQTYPSRRTVSYSYDAAGRTNIFTGNLGDNVTRTYASSISYDEWSGLSREQFGTDTALYHKERRNVRGQLYDMRLSTVNDADDGNRGAIVNYYSYQPLSFGGSGTDNNGNLLTQLSFVPDANGTNSYMQQYYAYDNLNRLSSVGEYQNGTINTGSQTFSYDQYGNRTISSASGTGINGKQFTVDTSTNRLGVPAGQSGVMQYDHSGNLTNDTYSGAGSRTYDAENRMISATNSGGQQSIYTYDADGMRVRRNSFGQEVWQVYGIDGELLAEYAASASPNSPQKEYGYRNGQLLITASPSSSGWGPAPTYTGDDPLHSGSQIKLENLTELRSAVNQLRSHAGLSPYVFTVDPNPVRYETPVKADHIRQLRAALEEALTHLGLPTGGYFQTTLQENTSLIYWKDFQELRDQIRNAWNSGTSGTDIHWIVTDHLGTTRIVADKSGSLSGIRRHDYLPFGEELYAGTGGRTAQQGYVADGVRQKFTQYERDNESGLDYAQARYYSSAQGRFTSPDSVGGSVLRPQTLNLYAYVRNNPLRYTDPTGHFPQDGSCGAPQCNATKEEVEEERRKAEAEGIDTEKINSKPAYPLGRPDFFEDQYLARPLYKILSLLDNNNRYAGGYGWRSSLGAEINVAQQDLLGSGILFQPAPLPAAAAADAEVVETTSVAQNALGRITQIRQTLNIGSGRNIAYATYEIEGQAGEVIGVSGQAQRVGTVGAPGERMFTTIATGNNPRTLDAEVKILENLASRFSSNAQGTVNLVSEKPLCVSCNSVVEQFRAAFPGIRLTITAGK